MSRPFTHGLLATVLLMGLPDAGRAQERLELVTFVNNQTRIVEVDATVRGFGVVTAITPILDLAPLTSSVFGGPASEPLAVAGGRYLAWAQDGLKAFDRRARRVIDASALLPQIPGAGRPLFNIRINVADTHQPRLFVTGEDSRGRSLWAIDFRGRPPVRLGLSRELLAAAAYVAATDEVFYLETGFDTNYPPFRWVVAVNATTGQELRRWKMATFVTAIRAEPTGRVLWVNEGGGITALDAATGVVLAASGEFNAELATFDAERGLLLVRQGDLLVAVDPLRLTELGRVRVAFTPPDPGMDRDAQTLPGRWMTGAYTVRVESRVSLLSTGRTGHNDRYAFTCNAIEIDALNASGARRESADILASLGAGGGAIGDRFSHLGCRAIGVLVRSPFAPKGLSAMVTGRTVSLAWQDPGDTSDFRLEVGFAPGERAIAVPLSSPASAVFANVPSGTYYLRVTAHNEVGGSPASNEVQVVVP